MTILVATPVANEPIQINAFVSEQVYCVKLEFQVEYCEGKI